MKKKLMLLVLALCCVLVLSACGCEHEWEEANCEDPKTCALCGETEGEALGHDWADATCDAPKTCEVCGETEGDPAGHSWVDASCAAPKTCEACGVTEGEALEHVWLDATTEAPKTCEACGETEGERIITDERFTTADTLFLHGTWEATVSAGGEMLGVEDFTGSIEILETYIFYNNGEYEEIPNFADVDAAKAAFQSYFEELFYTQFSASGMDTAAADETMVAAYGVTVPEYVSLVIEEMGLDTFADDYVVKGVYFVQDGVLYLAKNWDAEPSATPYTLDGDTLIMTIKGYDMEIEFTKKAE